MRFMFFVGAREDEHVLHNSPAIADIVEDVRGSPPIVVTRQRHTERKASILVAPERCGKCGQRGRLVIKFDLEVAFKRVNHCEKFHPSGDGAHCLKRTETTDEKPHRKHVETLR